MTQLPEWTTSERHDIFLARTRQRLICHIICEVRSQRLQSTRPPISIPRVTLSRRTNPSNRSGSVSIKDKGESKVRAAIVSVMRSHPRISRAVRISAREREISNRRKIFSNREIIESIWHDLSRYVQDCRIYLYIMIFVSKAPYIIRGFTADRCHYFYCNASVLLERDGEDPECYANFSKRSG